MVDADEIGVAKWLSLVEKAEVAAVAAGVVAEAEAVAKGAAGPATRPAKPETPLALAGATPRENSRNRQ